MVASGFFEVAGVSQSMDIADDAMLRRDVSVIVHMPPDLERDLIRDGVAPVQLIFNAEDGAAAGLLASYATRILSSYSAELNAELRPGLQVIEDGDALRSTRLAQPGAQDDLLKPGGGVGEAGTTGKAVPAEIQVSTRGWYNPGLDYTSYIVPGLLALLVTILATAIGSMNIVREKELGTLEQLNVTPVTKGQFIASKLAPFWVIAVAVLGLGLFVAWWIFEIPVRGSLLLIFASASVYLLVALGIGLWISTVVSTQQQAVFLSFALNMVYLLMSGLFTPIRSMPEWAQWLAELSPVKHFIVILRAVLVKGAGLAEVYPPLLALTGFAVIFLSLAVRQYSKTAV